MGFDPSLIKDLGLPVALAIYLLFQQRRFMDRMSDEQEKMVARIQQIEDERRRDARSHAADFRAVAERSIQTEERVISGLRDLATLIRDHLQAPEHPDARNGSISGLVPAVHQDPIGVDPHAKTRVMRQGYR